MSYIKGVQQTIFILGGHMTITPQDYFMIATSLIEKKKLLLSRDINPTVIEIIHDIDSLLEKIEVSDSKLEGLNTMIHQLY